MTPPSPEGPDPLEARLQAWRQPALPPDEAFTHRVMHALPRQHDPTTVIPRRYLAWGLLSAIGGGVLATVWVNHLPAINAFLSDLIDSPALLLSASGLTALPVLIACAWVLAGSRHTRSFWA
ncbi:MAG: hypothetical protein SFV32_04895 [Opitutaceae bacterium]|nr:hypothetical protein [Opitutaceae bacterium]